MLPFCKKSKLWDDLFGMDSVIHEILPWVCMVQSPDRFESMGVVVPRGIVLKETRGSQTDNFIRAIVDESGANMVVPEDMAMTRDVVNLARENQPAIIVLQKGYFSKKYTEDVCRVSKFEDALNLIHEHERIWVLVRLDKGEEMDNKFFSPGRFAQILDVPPMNEAARLAFLKKSAARLNLETDDAISYLSCISDELTANGLQIVLNKAAMRAISDGRTEMSCSDVVVATFPFMHGLPCDIGPQDSECLRAYHEAGHAVVFACTEIRDLLLFATIIPSGDTGGFVYHTMMTSSLSVNMFRAVISMLMGGRIAEEMLRGVSGITPGSMSDMEHAFKMAKKLVVKFGMGPSGLILCKKEYVHLSETMKQIVDNDIQMLLREGMNTARRILYENRQKLDAVAQALLQHKILTKDQILAIMK